MLEESLKEGRERILVKNVEKKDHWKKQGEYQVPG